MGNRLSFPRKKDKGFLTDAEDFVIADDEVHGDRTSGDGANKPTDEMSLLPQRNSRAMFTGRDTYLNKLKKYFCHQGKTRKSFLLYGMGGMGKTQICLNFVDKWRKLFSDIFWIDASSENSIDHRLRQIARAHNAPIAATLSAASALSWISRKKDWLMIYDNADGGYQVVEKFLPPGDEGNVLITSRNKELVRITLEENSMEVLEMGEEEALSLLESSAMLDYTSDDIRNLARQLVLKLACVPLAIDQAGAYMLACNLSLEDYLELFIRHQDQLTFDPEFKGAPDYEISIYGTWEISMKQIEERALNEKGPGVIAARAAIALLKIFAFLHHENIPEDLFKKAAENYINRDVSKEEKLGLPLLITMLDANTLFINKGGKWDKSQFQAGIQVLLSFSLIRSTGKMYSIHPLIHSWSMSCVSKAEIDKQYLITRALMSCSVDLTDRDKHEFCGFLAPHIRANNAHAKEFQLKSGYYDDEYDRFAQVFKYCGSYHEAEGLQTAVVVVRKAKLGLDHIHTVMSMKRLASVYIDQGKWNEVEKLELQVVDICKAKLGAEHPYTLSSMSNLAGAYWGQKRLDKAEKLLTKLLEKRKATHGEKHPTTLTNMERLAVAYMHQKRYSKAEHLLLDVLRIRKATFGSGHYDTISVMKNLGAVYHNQKKWGKAERYHLQVFEAYKTKLGSNHPDTFDSMGRLACTYRKLGRVDEATILLSQAVRALEQTVGSQHPNTLWLRKELDDLSKKGSSSALTK